MLPLFAAVTWEQYLVFFAAPVVAAECGALMAVGLDHLVSDERGSSTYNTGQWMFYGSFALIILVGFIALHSLRARPTALTFQIGAALHSGVGIDDAMAAIDKADMELGHRTDPPKRWVSIVLIICLVLAVVCEIPPFRFYKWWGTGIVIAFLILGWLALHFSKRLDVPFKRPVLTLYREQLLEKQAQALLALKPPMVAGIPGAASPSANRAAVDWRLTTGLLAFGAAAGSALSRRRRGGSRIT